MLKFFKCDSPVLQMWVIPLQNLFSPPMVGFLERGESFQDMLTFKRISPHYLKATLPLFPVLHFQLSTLSVAEVKTVPLLPG